MRQSGRRLYVRAKVIIKTPRTNLFAQQQHLGSVSRIGKLRHHAVEGRELVRQRVPVAVALSGAHYPGAPLNQKRRRTQDRTRPDAFSFYFRIERKRRTAGRGKSEIDCVTKFISSETQPQIDALFAASAFHIVFTALDGSAQLLWSSPQRGLQTTFARQRRNDAALSCLGQQSQRAIDARLAAPVWAGDEVQLTQRDDQVAQ